MTKQRPKDISGVILNIILINHNNLITEILRFDLAAK